MKQALGRFLGIVAWALVSPVALADVPTARDLRKDAEAVTRLNGTLLVVLVGEHCSSCERVLNEFLIPMSGHSGYRDRVVMRRVVVADH